MRTHLFSSPSFSSRTIHCADPSYRGGACIGIAATSCWLCFWFGNARSVRRFLFGSFQFCLTWENVMHCDKEGLRCASKSIDCENNQVISAKWIAVLWMKGPYDLFILSLFSLSVMESVPTLKLPYGISCRLAFPPKKEGSCRSTVWTFWYFQRGSSSPRKVLEKQPKTERDLW